MIIEIHPTTLWRYGVSETALLALSQHQLAEDSLDVSPVLSSAMAGNALGLDIGENWDTRDPSVEAAAMFWQGYDVEQWKLDVSALFGTAEVPKSHPCEAVYAFFTSVQPGLQDPDLVHVELRRLIRAIGTSQSDLVSLHKAAPTDPAIPLEMIPFDSALYHLSGRRWFLQELQRALEAAQALEAGDVGSLCARITLLQAFCIARVAGKIPWHYELVAETQNPFAAKVSDYRELARHLFDRLPNDERGQALFHLASFQPEGEDRQRFLQRFEAGDSPALSLMVKLWPDPATFALIVKTVELGLAAPSEELSQPDAKQTRWCKLSALGRRVDSAIDLLHKFLPPADALRYYATILQESPVTNFRQSAARWLGEMGTQEAAELLAETVSNARGWEISVVAEAVSEAPCANGLAALSRLVTDRALRLNRLPVIETLLKHQPDDTLRNQLTAILSEPGCRCAGCVWRQAMWGLASTWPDETSRGLVEDRFANEPGYVGKIGAARVLAKEWPDVRTARLLAASMVEPNVSGSGEGDSGHLAFDGQTALAEPGMSETASWNGRKYVADVMELLAALRGEDTTDAAVVAKQVSMIAAMLWEKSAQARLE